MAEGLRCDAPDCARNAETEFTADASGRLGGRDWRTGDTLRFCWPHAHDIYQTIGKDDPSQVAEWLRPDAADPPNTWIPPSRPLSL